MNHYDKDSLKALKTHRRKHENMIECYLGKRDLLQTYEQMKIYNEDYFRLKTQVRRKLVYIKNKGI